MCEVISSDVPLDYNAEIDLTIEDIKREQEECNDIAVRIGPSLSGASPFRLCLVLLYPKPSRTYD